jgi:hypothetical protein
MALFKVNTGCREQEVCKLKWEWEVQVPEFSSSVFIIPGAHVKNADDRLVVLNRVARSVIEEVRGEHADFVFTYRGHPVAKIYNSAWKCARERAADGFEEETKQPAPWGFRNVRVHDLKHTFGRRLRAAGVSFEDRQDLLGHRSGRITTHYSQAELENLIAAADKVRNVRPSELQPTGRPRRCGRRGTTASSTAAYQQSCAIHSRRWISTKSGRARRSSRRMSSQPSPAESTESPTRTLAPTFGYCSTPAAGARSC